jgi:phage terminase small subunit
MVTPKQQRFIDEFMVDRNATRSAIDAGYSPKTAASQASRLLRNVNVAAAIEHRQRMLSAETGIKAAEVIKELARIAFCDIRQLVEWGPNSFKLVAVDKLGPDQTACVSEVTEKQTSHGTSRSLKTHSKVEALKLLGQHLGIFTEVKLNVSLGSQTPMEEMTDDELRAIASGGGTPQEA